jgi:hypothetical protein
MNERAPFFTPLPMAEKLAQAQQVFDRFHTHCFWFMREDRR